jgi:hypothetical protein
MIGSKLIARALPDRILAYLAINSDSIASLTHWAVP